MADATVVHIGENSPEKIALEMTDQIIRYIEGKSYDKITRKDYLDTYSECIQAVKGSRSKPSKWPSEQ